VLEDGTGLFGWASTGLARDEEPAARVHELFALYLDPQRVGEGHGRRLMTHCLSDATQRGFGEIVLWVIEGNEPARRFYAAAGFDLDEDTEPQPYRDTGTLQVRLKRSLSEPVPFMTG
jgi:GNAT superfamily N-acetyltransferase